MPGGGFYTGVAPPKSKYHNVQFRLENLDICPERDSFSEKVPEVEDDWMCSSRFDEDDQQTTHHNNDVYNGGRDEEYGDNDKNACKMQKFTSQQWLEEIENRWFDSRDDVVRQSFQAALNDVQEPFSFVLHVMLTTHFDLFSKRIPITFFSLDELDIWLELKRTNREHVPEPEELFLLDERENSYLAEYIILDIDLNPKKLKQIAVIITATKLQREFSAQEVLLPLLATDQIQVVETYVGQDKTLQVEYAQFLDWLCGMKKDTVEQMVSNLGLTIKDPSKLQHKTIIKMAERLSRNMNLIQTTIPVCSTRRIFRV